MLLGVWFLLLFLLLDLDLVLQLIDLVEILRAFWSVFACLPTPTRGRIGLSLCFLRAFSLR